MTIQDRDFDAAVRKAMRKYDLTVDEVREGENSYLVSNDSCLLDIWEAEEGIYSVGADLVSSATLRKDYHVDPYRFYTAMTRRLPFSMKLDREGIVYSILNDSPYDMADDIGECILVSKMFYSMFDDVVAELLGKRP